MLILISMSFIKQYWIILASAISVIFGYANFTADIKANAGNISKVEADLKQYKEKTDDKLDHLIRMTERIDERTSEWRKKQ